MCPEVLADGPLPGLTGDAGTQSVAVEHDLHRVGVVPVRIRVWNRLDDRDIEEARSLGPIRDLLSVSGSVLVGMGGDPVEVLQPVATDRPGLVGPVNEVCRQLPQPVGTPAPHT